MNISALNLSALREQYERTPATAEVRKIMAMYSPARLETLLRHHKQRMITGRDVDRRASFDKTIEYYSVMEIAAIAGYIPARLPEDYAVEAQAMLDNLHVQTYYAVHYPLLLPQLHARRLRGEWAARETGSQLPALFIAFTQLNKALNDDDVETFLWMLESGSIDDVGLEDLLAIIRDPAKFAEAMLDAPDDAHEELDLLSTLDAKALRNPKALLAKLNRRERVEDDDPARAALRGFQTFLFFSRDLHRLLLAMDAVPLTQSAMWHYHSYWYVNFGAKLLPYVNRAIDQFVGWSDPTDADASTRAAEELREAVRKLTSRDYATALENAAHTWKRRGIVVPAVSALAGAAAATVSKKKIGTKRRKAAKPIK